MKLMIWLGIMIGGTVGGWIGAALTHGNWLSIMSILFSGIGSLVGIWTGYKIGKTYL